MDTFTILLKSKSGEEILIDQSSADRFQELEDGILENKIGGANRVKRKSVEQIIKIFQTLSQGKQTNASILPLKLLIKEKAELDSVIETFAQARALDMRNERMP